VTAALGPDLPGALYLERLRMPRRAWALFAFAAGVSVLVVSPLAVPLVAIAWGTSFLRFRHLAVRIDRDRISVGRKALPLTCLDLSTLRQARNPWPWRFLSRRYLGANPIWTDDSVSLQGRLQGRKVIVSVGTNRREELVRALGAAVADAKAAGPWGPPFVAPAPGWYPDPWGRHGGLRWWDGQRWTPFVTAPQPPGSTP